MIEIRRRRGAGDTLTYVVGFELRWPSVCLNRPYGEVRKWDGVLNREVSMRFIGQILMSLCDTVDISGVMKHRSRSDQLLVYCRLP